MLKKLIFSNTKVSFREDGDYESSPSMKTSSKSVSYFLKFNKNNQITEIYTQDVKIFQSWKRFLRYKCILSSFHDDFDVRKMIGKGSFAKVIKNELFKINIIYKGLFGGKKRQWR